MPQEVFDKSGGTTPFKGRNWTLTKLPTTLLHFMVTERTYGESTLPVDPTPLEFRVWTTSSGLPTVTNSALLDRPRNLRKLEVPVFEPSLVTLPDSSQVGTPLETYGPRQDLTRQRHFSSGRVNRVEGLESEVVFGRLGPTTTTFVSEEKRKTGKDLNETIDFLRYLCKRHKFFLF